MPDDERSTGGADHRTIVDVEGVTLHYYVWEAERPRAVVHIAHGVGEHALRYIRLARELNAAGFTVAADDHRGHGATGLGHLGIGVLGPRRHLAALDGIQLVSEQLRLEHPDLPLVLLGHSWGALLAQRIVARASHLYAGLVLSGASLAMPGVINTGDLNKRWRHPAASGFEWLSRDPEAQRAFGADDRNFDVNALKPYRMRDSVQIMGRPPRKLATDLPVLIQGGEEDSLGGRRGIAAARTRLQQAVAAQRRSADRVPGRAPRDLQRDEPRRGGRGLAQLAGVARGAGRSGRSGGRGARMTAADATLRPARADDLPFLEDMLLASMDWRDDGSMTRERMLATPELAHYVSGWPRAGDVGVVAEADGEPVGAVWARLYAEDDRGYGFVAPDIPELGMALVPSARGRGLGRALLVALVAAVRASGAPAVSLSVEDGNDRARALYDSLGFVAVGREGGSDVLLLRW
ncbi:GNAT family N-acetyltransferase [Clavibacter michiganensis]|uniref:GNAT family N-acetyltransferase n=2 Tax=Clavibacter michiganensis TaxID=28447 RepID=UPI003EBDCAC3